MDSVDETRNLCRKQGYTFDFLSDPQAEVIRRYGVLHAGGAPDAKDIARPAEFLLDRAGIVRWENFTENLGVRARPQQVLAAAQSLH